MPLLLLWHPGVEGAEPPEPPPTAEEITPQTQGSGGAWAHPSVLRKRRRLRDEDLEIQATMGALAGELLVARRKHDTDEDLIALIGELAPDFMKGRRRIQ